MVAPRCSGRSFACVHSTTVGMVYGGTDGRLRASQLCVDRMITGNSFRNCLLLRRRWVDILQSCIMGLARALGPMPAPRGVFLQYDYNHHIRLPCLRARCMYTYTHNLLLC